MEQFTDQLWTFVQDRWLVILLAIVAMALIVKVVKSVIKWLLIIGLAVALILYGSNYSGELKDNIVEIGTRIAEYTKDEAVKAMLGEASSAQYKETEDGFIITTGGFTLEGTPGGDEAVLSYKGQSITLQMNDTLNAFIEGARAAQSAK